MDSSAVTATGVASTNSSWVVPVLIAVVAVIGIGAVVLKAYLTSKRR